MKIVIDMQGAQSMGSRTRGIGRYTSSIVKAILAQGSQHEIILAVSGLFPETVPLLRADFDGLLPKSNIRVWQCPPQVAYHDKSSTANRKAAELTYEAFLQGLEPDFILVTSLFEGFVDDAVTSIHCLQQTTPVAVVLYDLIPLLHPSLYLEKPDVKSWYLEKIGHLRRANLWLAISESSRQEGIAHLNLPDDRSVNISTAADEFFRDIPISSDEEQAIRSRYGLHNPFVMYTGGIDHRKNIEGLIRAYAKLPAATRQNHQLAIVCSVQDEARKTLEALAAAQGLNKGEIIFPGFVPDGDLLTLYNLCTLFVFPSWHEGFGLPALEAMRCGAPVIGANTSSLPEVIGWEEALFDPRSEDAITRSIQRALTDEGYRHALRERGRQQVTQFSWSKSAQLAIAAMEQYLKDTAAKPKPLFSGPPASRPKLAYVSPLPPARTGIADYSAELLPELSKYYDIDVVVDQAEALTAPWAPAYCLVRTAQWFLDNASQYDRVLYHFGNSQFHEHMFGLLAAIPGVVVLHDFYLSNILAHQEYTGAVPHAWEQALLHSHGYHAIQERHTTADIAEVILRYPANLAVLQQALGVIVHSEYSRALARHWYGPSAAADWAVVELLRTPPESTDRDAARQALGYAPDDLLFCSFGILGPIKLNDRLLAAWEKSSLAANQKAHLVFVGQISEGPFGQTINETIQNSASVERIKITGWADTQLFRQYLLAADVGIQLRTLTRGETSATVLDCMNNGLATIVNAHGSMADLDPTAVWLLSDQFTDAELCEALETLANQPGRRQQIGERAMEIIRTRHAPEQCARRYHDAIEAAYLSSKALNHQLHGQFARLDLPDTQLQSWAMCLASNFPPTPRRPQLLLDISVLAVSDARSGIQRVSRSVLSACFALMAKGPCIVRPIRFDQGQYWYANRYAAELMGLEQAPEPDLPIDTLQGDIYLALDLMMHLTDQVKPVHDHMAACGVSMNYVLYDLLPLHHPEWWVSPIGEQFRHWLEAITGTAHRVVCISNTVASEYRLWLADTLSDGASRPSVKHFHLGADIENSHPSMGMLQDAPNVLTAMKKRPSFLMVSTLEPRKGHDQVLSAFEDLWLKGEDINLVIVGKRGWLVDNLVERLENHCRSHQNLFWLEGISDEFLQELYRASDALISASEGEGYGLPLIEAAQHRLPIIARDLPVFREVAGEHAFYFNGNTPGALVDALQQWLKLFHAGHHPRSDSMPWLTWQQSCRQLLDALEVTPPSTPSIHSQEINA